MVSKCRKWIHTSKQNAMNENFEQHNMNHYEGNGWSKYQLMVLQQLDDHNKLLQNMNKDIADIKQTIAVSDTELKMWRAQVMATTHDLEESMDHLLYDEKGLGQKLIAIEREIDVEEQSHTKWKASMALYGSITVFLINALVQIAAIFLKK